MRTQELAPTQLLTRDLPLGQHAESREAEGPTIAPDRDRPWPTAILEVTRSLLATTAQDSLSAVACAVKDLSRSDFVLVILPVANEVLMVEVAVGDGTEFLPGYTYCRTGSIAGEVLDEDEAAIVPDARQSASVALNLLSGHIDIGPVMFIPLPGESEGRGVLVVGRRPGREEFGQRDVDAAIAFAGHAALALELADGRRYRQRMILLEERNRVARDLHDQVLQRLFATEMAMQVIAAGADPACAEQIAQLIETTDETIAGIRAVIQDLNQADAAR